MHFRYLVAVVTSFFLLGHSTGSAILHISWVLQLCSHPFWGFSSELLHTCFAGGPGILNIQRKLRLLENNLILNFYMSSVFEQCCRGGIFLFLLLLACSPLLEEESKKRVLVMLPHPHLWPNITLQMLTMLTMFTVSWVLVFVGGGGGCLSYCAISFFLLLALWFSSTLVMRCCISPTHLSSLYHCILISLYNSLYLYISDSPRDASPYISDSS